MILEKTLREKPMKKLPLSPCFLSAAMALAVGMSSAYAVNGSWNVDASGNWNDAANWTSNPTVPGGAGSVVGLTYDITTGRVITINTTPAVVGVLNIGDASGTSLYTLASSGGAYLEMNNNGVQAEINATGGSSDRIHDEIRMTTGGLLIRNTGADSLNVGNFVAGNIVTNGHMLTLSTNGNNLVVGSTISGSGSLLVDSAGVGQITVGSSPSPDSTFSGGTVLRNGTVAIGRNSAFGAGSITLGGSGNTGTVVLLANSSTRSIANNLVVSNATANALVLRTRLANSQLTMTGNIDLQRNLELNRNGGGAIILSTGTISGAGGLSLTGDGIVTRLASVGTYAGGVSVNVGNATLQLGSATALGTGTLTIGASASNFSLDTTGSDLTLTTNNAIALNQNLTYSGSNNSHLNLGTGNVTLSAGNKIITTTAGVLTIGGAVIGTSGQNLTKAGSGILALNGTNTYTGETSVSAGTLRGNGSVAGDLWIGGGATLEAGNSIGTFTAAGEAGFLDGSTFQFELNSSAGTFDQLVANGLSLENNNVTFSVADLGVGVWSGPASFVIVENTSGTAVGGTFGGYAEGSNVNIGENVFTISYVGGTGNDVTLTYNVIPEPGAWMLVTVGLGLTLLRRRRA